MKFAVYTLILFATRLAVAVETYEVRIYHLNSAENAKQWDDWMSASGVADLKNSGATKVGAFKSIPTGEADHKRIVLAVYPSIASLKPINGEAVIQSQDNESAEAYLNPPESAYSRIDTSLLTAFPSFTKLVDPEGEGNGERIFELRVYESRSERTAALKVEMFGKGGEISIFHEVGLTPVFFGSARFAGNLPQLTYMLVHENEEDLKKSWSSFVNADSWNKLKRNPRYKGTVSKIHKHLLTALPFSDLK